jgi:Zn-dependent M16 (insulinase) family peptidase
MSVSIQEQAQLKNQADNHLHAASMSAPETHPSFEWIRSQHIPSLNVTMEEYRHKKTGAQYYHLASDNTENVFLVALRTVPMDSTGVAHILEHTALCGSEKYPVRDPFFMMIRRSLNTFMNAFTSSDWTAYPFASKNRKDFDNLLQVYMDAVFFSRLHELDFAQEGHRLEFADAEDSSSDLQYKGVVYNEMKGAMSSTNAILWQTLSRYLFPGTTYHYNSGGEPDHIPDLSYQDLKDFYKSHYHPSNAVFMTYGDIPAIAHQEKFETLALARFDKLDINIVVEDEKRYFAPVRVQESYPLDEADGSDKTHVVMAWLLGKSTNLEEMFEAQLLSSVLLDNSASPLMQVLETTALGKSPSPLCGLEDSNREMSFLCGLEGCAEDSSAVVEQLIRDTLTAIAEKGVDQEQVEAALHQLELSQREISGDSHPYGLQLILTGLSAAIHRGDPIQVMDIDPVLAGLREKIKDPQFIPKLIKQHLLSNQHNVVLTLKPEPELSERQLQAEMQRLRQIKEQLSPQQIEDIIARSKALAQRQAQEDDPGSLPKVGLEDVPAEIPELVPQKKALNTSTGKVVPVTFYGQGTNGLSYQQIVVDLPHLDEELLPLLPWYTSCLTEFGIGTKSYQDVQTWQSRVSGGVNCYANIRSDVDNEQQTKSILVLSGKALQSNQQALAELLHATFHDCRFDEQQRLREILEQILSRQEGGITGRGHSLAIGLASSRMSPSAALSYRFGGLAGIKALKSQSKEFDKQEYIESVLAKFAKLHQQILQAPRQFLLIAEENHGDEVIQSLDSVWCGSDQLAADTFSPLQLPAMRENVQQMWTTNTQVNFCARAYPTVTASHSDNAVLAVLSGFLRNGYLHRVIREQGGAYGGGADQDANSASFRFYSYRDPRFEETLNDFDRAVDWVITGKHQWRQVEESILGVISAMDKPSSPAGEAKQHFYNTVFGRTREQRAAFRKRVLEVQVDDLREVAIRYLQGKPSSTGVVSSTGQLKTAEQLGLEVFNL